MKKYNLEENIDFYAELFKLLDDANDTVQEKLCQITSMPLTDKYVTLECNHNFNYIPLYKEIINQKYKFKTYEIKKLNKKDHDKVKASGSDYYIKCPYCRNIQFTILPYYEELDVKKIYGINSLGDETTECKQIFYKTEKQIKGLLAQLNESNNFILYGKEFKKGKCCIENHDESKHLKCQYVATVPNTDKSYCRYHYKDAEKKQKILEKQDKLNTMNAIREANGLKPLKYLRNKTYQNIVQPSKPIEIYVPEPDANSDIK